MDHNDFAIKVSNLSKCYQIYSQPEDRLKQSIYPRLQRLIRRLPQQYFREFWALKNVSFEIRKGETVGIIGRNGSGKSTLLQMICGILEPTAGQVETRGRVAALLELGAGFNPEFTGRENVHMNAMVLGLSQAEINARFDDIAAFADIGDFIEQPVKLYSSGMFARLAFAVAINVQPSILIVDEALAVGDEAFQRKCFARMEKIKADGATILLVAHSGSLITQLCDRAIVLNKGVSLYTGAPKNAVAWYQKLVAAPENAVHKIIQEMVGDVAIRLASELDNNLPLQLIEVHHPSILDKSENQSKLTEYYDENLKSLSVVFYEKNGAEISDIRIETLMGIKVNCLLPRERYRFRYAIRFDCDVSLIECHFRIKTVSGFELGGGMKTLSMTSLPNINQHSLLDVSFEFDCNLLPGSYFLNCGIIGDGEVLHRLMDITMFRVQNDGLSHAVGFVDFNVTAVTSYLS